MAFPKEAKVITVVDSQRLEIDGSVTPTRQVRYMIQKYGPFLYETPLALYTQERADAAVQKTVDDLRGLNALEPETPAA